MILEDIERIIKQLTVKFMQKDMSGVAKIAGVISLVASCWLYGQDLTDYIVMCIFDLMTTIVALSAIYLGTTLFGWTGWRGKTIAFLLSFVVCGLKGLLMVNYLYGMWLEISILAVCYIIAFSGSVGCIYHMKTDDSKKGLLWYRTLFGVLCYLIVAGVIFTYGAKFHGLI